MFQLFACDGCTWTELAFPRQRYHSSQLGPKYTSHTSLTAITAKETKALQRGTSSQPVFTPDHLIAVCYKLLQSLIVGIVVYSLCFHHKYYRILFVAVKCKTKGCCKKKKKKKAGRKGLLTENRTAHTNANTHMYTYFYHCNTSTL